MHRLADLREILRYVPQYRDSTFVIGIDGHVVEDPNFRNLLLDIRLLWSLRIRVVLVHGAGHQIRQLAHERGVTPSNIDGAGVTDAPTLNLAISAANRVTHEILEGLFANDLRGACSNAIVAHPAGILEGVDHQMTGRVERVDLVLLDALLESDIVPVIPPLGCDGEGNTYRINSDSVASDVAKALHASKLIYLTTIPGVTTRAADGSTSLVRQLKLEDAEALLRRRDLGEPATSKLRHAVKALRGDVRRVHIINGHVEEGLLGEVFSNEGIGTLVYVNEYHAIRPAKKKDAREIYALIRAAVENAELAPRTLSEIERHIADYYVFDVDGALAGCVALHPHLEFGKAEMACVCVNPKFENQGIGGRMMNFAEAQARSLGVKTLFCLSTQAVNYFVQKGGFRLGEPDDLPPTRRQRYEVSGRRSKVLLKSLS